MRKLKVFLLFLVLAVVVGAQGFEGFVKYKVDAAGESTNLKYYKKGNMMRMEPELKGTDMGGAIIFKGDKTYMLMPGQKMYMEMSDNMPGMMGGRLKDDNSDMDEDFEKPINTGETKDILGYTCEKWIFKDDETTVELWAAKGLGDFVMLSSPMGQDNLPNWYNEISEGGFFPMSVTAMDSDGNVQSKMEVIDIKEESVADSMFEIPSNYKKFNIPGME